MESPVIVEHNQLLLMGFSYFGDPFQTSAGWTEENEIGRLWKRFMSFVADHEDVLPAIRQQQYAYEVHVRHPETYQSGEYEVFVGVELETFADIPVEMSIKLFPAATYALFTLQGAEIASDWSMGILEWMLESDYEDAYPYGLQRYDQRFKGIDQIDESILDVLVPIRRSETAGTTA